VTFSFEEPGAPVSVDEGITAERQELKYLLPAERLSALVSVLSSRLPSHRFVGEGANRLPDPNHYVTTTYFDTGSRRNYRAAIANYDANVKFRAKEYYDLHPSLAELATDPEHIVRYHPWLWFELKTRDGHTTTKQRLRIPKRAVPALFASGRVVAGSLDLEEFGIERAQSQRLDAIIRYCAGLDEPLEASCLVNYRRLSFQSEDGALRVTVDLGLSFYEAPVDLWTRTRALVRHDLGPSRGALSDAVVEVKHRAGTPVWLERALSGAGVEPVQFSKFVAASGAVHGAL
jgi:hypothetical protein